MEVGSDFPNLGRPCAARAGMRWMRRGRRLEKVSELRNLIGGTGVLVFKRMSS
jgi:hypothetical protein